MDINLPVTIPFSRIIALVTHLGSQHRDVCPPVDLNVCWRHRDLPDYLGGTTEMECPECWIRFIMNGD